MSETNDRNLRDAFSALDRTVQATAPKFSDLTSEHARRGQQRYRLRRTAALAMVVALVPLAVAVRGRLHRGLDFEHFARVTGIDPGSVSWRAPSDVLLNVPGNDFLKNIPVIRVEVPALSPDSTRRPDSNANPRRSSDL